MDHSQSSSEVTATESEHSEGDSWISWFCSQRGNEFLCEVDVSFIKDEFNMVGLSEYVDQYQYAHQLILDDPALNSDDLDNEVLGALETHAERLYKLIHQRFITTSRGLEMMAKKFVDGAFGLCPRFYCEHQHLLPMGQSDQPGKGCLKMYCPRCEDVYTPQLPQYRYTDGCAFGSSFPHIFLLEFPSFLPPPPQYVDQPRVFGFKVSQGNHHRRLEKHRLRTPPPTNRDTSSVVATAPTDYSSYFSFINSLRLGTPQTPY
ncbi:putative Casein kinase II subunit beta [Blattamonas nauphoetae]|uniref:Casein kinase II subunit beta n=1 Tax=Blattamonas nauphoetae TaxID=2049346 RepID=A0ABQ9YK51_9EUKA|nr:putative Casein kinase II subunit beta [Blattamonas nauphoetae]